MIFKNPAKKNIIMLLLILCLVFILFQMFSGCKTTGSEGKEDKEQTEIKDENQEKKDKIPFPEPGSHDSGWMEYHGKIVSITPGSPFPVPGDCNTCHRQNDCIECHNTRAPRDHNNRWRTLAHGLTACANRDRCYSCHRQDYCIRCHNETSPRSHKGNWEENHCQWCHFSETLSSVDNCSVCHKQALHITAPHPVNAGLNCFDCH